MSADEYHDAPGVSNTMLGHLEPTPSHLISYLNKPPEVTKAMELGTDFHALTLQEIAPKVVIHPDTYPDPKGEAKNWTMAANYCKDWILDNVPPGARTMRQRDYDSLYGARDAVMRHRIEINGKLFPLSEILETSEKEFPLFAPWDGGRVMRKGLIDVVPNKWPVLLDFKRTPDASPVAFGKKIGDMKYHRQGKYYLDLAAANGLPHVHFILVAVETKEPYRIGSYYLTDRHKQSGLEQYERLLSIYARCSEANEWPTYPAAPQPALIPERYLREEAASL